MRNDCSGFSLVELLTAVTVAAVLAALSFMVASGFLANWTRSSGRLAAQAKARFLLNQVAVDLQSAVWSGDGQGELIASILDRTDNSGLWQISARQKPPAVALMSENVRDLRFGQAGVWLRFFTSRSGLNESGTDDSTVLTVSAPVAVAYQLIRRLPHGSGSSRTSRYCLNRSEVRAAQTGGRMGTLEAGFDLATSSPPNAYAASGEVIEVGDSASIQRPESTDMILTEDVIDFGVKIYTRDENGTMHVLFPREETDREFSVYRSASASPTLENSFPRVIDVFVRVLSPEGTERIAALEAGKLGARPAGFVSDADWWWDLALANSELFSRRVELTASPP